MSPSHAATVFTSPGCTSGDEPQISMNIDREKCARLGVRLADVFDAMQKAAPTAKTDPLKKQIATLKKLVISSGGAKATLGEIAAIDEVTGPSAIYRIDLYPAIRISGTPPKGTSVAETAAKCAELAKSQNKREGFAVKNLSAK